VKVIPAATLVRFTGAVNNNLMTGDLLMPYCIEAPFPLIVAEVILNVSAAGVAGG
jgi:hypothetical protein